MDHIIGHPAVNSFASFGLKIQIEIQHQSFFHTDVCHAQFLPKNRELSRKHLQAVLL